MYVTASVGAVCLAAATAGAGGARGAGASEAGVAAPAAVPALLGSTSSVPGPAPLANTWTGTQGSWAVVAMGHLGQPLNTFWQLLFRPAGESSWQLVTPAGVADNGGLVADAGPTAAVTAGFEPTSYLRYSPLARSADSGRNWSPGILPAALMAVPDAVTGTPTGGALVLARSSGGTLLAGPASLSSWRVLARRASLASTSAGRSCGLVALRAVSDARGEPEVGASCTTPGVVGIFGLEGGRWQSGGTRLTGEARRLTTTVLRLEGGPSGTRALVQAGRGRRARLFALWRDGPSEPWASSAALRPAGPLEATGFGPSGSMVVVTGASSGGGRAGAASVAGPGGAWSALPDVPRRTAVVAEGPDGEVDALAVSGSVLTDYRLGAADGTWQRVQVLPVPIQYGSST